jgi:site-specific DNA recombinase
VPTCAIYARVSTDHQGDSVDHQISLMTAFAKQKGSDWIVDERFIYRDDGKSGTSIIYRPAVQRLIADAEKGFFDVVLFKGISRFARDIVDAVSMMRVLRSLNIRVVSFEEGFDSEQGDSEFLFNLHASLAEYESKKIGLRVKIGHIETAKRGQWAKGRAPFGYVINRKTKKLEPHPEQAPIVRMIFDMYVNQGYGMYSIAKYLNEHGIATNFGQKWTQVTIRLLLRNEVYIGRIIYGLRRHEKKYKPGSNAPITKVQMNDRENVIIVDNAHEPLVDKYTFRRAQEITKSRRIDRTDRGVHMLSGILRCPKCEVKMISHATSRKRADGTRYETMAYACRNRRKYGPEVCDAPNINGKKIERLVIQHLEDTFKNMDIEQLREIILDNLNLAANPIEILGITEKKIEDIEAQLVNANMKNMQGIMDDKTLATITKRLNAEKEKLEKLRIEIMSNMDDKQETEEQVDIFLRAVERFKRLEKIDDDNRVEARRILEEILDWVMYKDEELIVKFHFDIEPLQKT